MTDGVDRDWPVGWGPPERESEVTVDTVGSRLVVEWQNIGRLTASLSGEDASFDPFPSATPRVLQKFRATHLVACTRYLRGELTVHGSAVGFDAGALALVGESGAGKSTTAMALVEKYEGRFLADDMVPVDWHEGSPMVIPVADHLWLTPRSAAHFGASAVFDWKAPHEPRERASGGERLRAIVHLLFDDTTDEVTLEPLSGQEQFLVLSRTHVCYTSRREEGAVRHLAARADLARAVPMFRLRRPRSFDSFDTTASLLRSCL
jgi:hypothetical protein